MRYLIVSDLHSNREALEAVLTHAAGMYDRVICCGDVVGYGPDPNPVVEWTRANAWIVVRGNHDRACCGAVDLEWFNDVAKEASLWTMTQLTPENLDWLRSLRKGPIVEDGFQIVHGSPLDEDEYVSNLNDAANVLSYVESDLTFFGHTHLQGGFSWVEGKRGVIGRPDYHEDSVAVKLKRDGAYLVNPGSVGQPRDGDARAAYAIYDGDAAEVRLHRVPYNFGTVERRIFQAGLPPVLGSRLALGR